MPRKSITKWNDDPIRFHDQWRHALCEMGRLISVLLGIEFLGILHNEIAMEDIELNNKAISIFSTDALCFDISIGGFNFIRSGSGECLCCPAHFLKRMDLK